MFGITVHFFILNQLWVEFIAALNCSLNPIYLKISGDKGKTKLVHFYYSPKKKSGLTLFNTMQVYKRHQRIFFDRKSLKIDLHRHRYYVF